MNKITLACGGCYTLHFIQLFTEWYEKELTQKLLDDELETIHKFPFRLPKKSTNWLRWKFNWRCSSRPKLWSNQHKNRPIVLSINKLNDDKITCCWPQNRTAWKKKTERNQLTLIAAQSRKLLFCCFRFSLWLESFLLHSFSGHLITINHKQKVATFHQSFINILRLFAVWRLRNVAFSTLGTFFHSSSLRCLFLLPRCYCPNFRLSRNEIINAQNPKIGKSIDIFDVSVYEAIFALILADDSVNLCAALDEAHV